MRQVQLLTKRGLLLLCLAREPGSTARTLARELGVTEGTVRLALRDLAEAGYVYQDRSHSPGTHHVNYGRALDGPPVLQRGSCGRYPTTGEILSAFLGDEIQYVVEAECPGTGNGHSFLGRLAERLRLGKPPVVSRTWHRIHRIVKAG